MQSSDHSNADLIKNLEVQRDQINKSNQSYRGEAKKQKQAVLDAAIRYLSRYLTLEEFQNILKQNPKYDESIGPSKTKDLINKVLAAKVEKPHVDVNAVFKNFPNEEYWKMIIDFLYWSKKDPHVFDKDASKNYLKNTTNALLYTLETVNDSLSDKLIIEIHDYAYHDKDPSILGLQESAAASGFSQAVTSKKGLIQMIQQMRQDPDQILSLQTFDYKTKEVQSVDIHAGKVDEIADEILLESKNNPNLQLQLVRKKMSVEQIRGKMIAFIHDYDVAMKMAKTKVGLESEHEKLKAIIHFIQQIHQFHPFKDGNGRTFIFLLLNKLLMMNHLSPSTVEMPARFTGYSEEELLEEVVRGQKHFKNLCSEQTNKKPFLDFLRNKVPAPNENKFFKDQKNEQFHLQQVALQEQVNRLQAFYNEVDEILKKAMEAASRVDAVHDFHELGMLRNLFLKDIHIAIEKALDELSNGGANKITIDKMANELHSKLNVHLDKWPKAKKIKDELEGALKKLNPGDDLLNKSKIA